MTKDFILPDIGEGIVECEVVEWLVSEGDEIQEDQPVCDVMTDKALVQIPAMEDGVVSKLYYQKGEIAKVHSPLFALTPKSSANLQSVPSDSTVQTTVDEPVEQETEVKSSSTTEDFLLPDIGEGIVECELVDWLVAEGDEIKEDQAICDVMTDKALVQIPAKSDGVITKLYYAKGEIAKVHSPLFAITVAGNTSSNSASNTTTNVPSTSKPVTETDVKGSDVASEKSSVKNNVVTLQQTSTNTSQQQNKKAVASPAVRRLAREMNIDIREVAGSGEKGRVYKQDIHNHVNGVQSTSSSDVRLMPSNASHVEEKVRVEPIRGIKAAMAKAMVESVSTIPHFTYSDEIDLTALVALRKELKPVYEKQGIKLTMMPFFVKAMSLALKQFPILNTQVNQDCTELTYFDDHNIGMAVDSKVGLLVPNIKTCQEKSIKDIAQEVMALTEKAREGRLAPEQLKGGTISISNIGALGGTTATPIINKPEVAIVALGKMQTLPRFNSNGEVEARMIMQVSWSGDHRIIDGGTIARFNNLWTSYLENPSSMLMEMS